MRHARHYPTELYLCTTIQRRAPDGEVFEVDIIVYFEARMTSPGCRARIYGDPSNCWPAESPEYDLTFASAALDGIPGVAGPITAIEEATLRAWFNAHEAEAFECANDNFDHDNHHREAI